MPDFLEIPPWPNRPLSPPAARPTRCAGWPELKGRNLYELDRRGVAVPPWAIVGTDIFASFLDECGVTDELKQLLATVTSANTDDIAARASALITAGELGPAARGVIETAYRHAGAEWVAVRSSGAEEDGAEHSFAGQFDTFLNVRGLGEVLAKVKECWASAFSARSLQYRCGKNLSLDAGQMAVIVQQMLNPQRSGVLFTANPATGSRAEYVVSSVYGLGEGLVCGAVDADTVVLDAASGESRNTVIGEKERRYDAAAGSSCTVSEVPADLRSVLSVTPADLAALREAGAALTEIFGTPQDIEWSVADDRLWILQSRPITTLIDRPPAIADGEMRIWDNSNIIESFSGITSPLTFSFAANAYGKTYAYYARALRVPADQRRQMDDWLPNLLGYFHGHVYYNLLHWYRMVRITPGYAVTRKVLEVAMGVEEPLPDELANSVYPYTFSSASRRRIAQTVTAATFAYRFLTMGRAVARFRRYFYGAYQVFNAVDYDELPADEVYRRYRDLERDLIERWGPMQLLDVTILISLGALHVLTARWLPDAPEWFGWAVAAPGEGIESAEPARALTKLAETVRGDTALHKIVTETEPGDVRDVLAGAGLDSFLAAVDNYVAKYGYRSPDELKLKVPDLREDPSNLFAMLRDALAESTATAGGESAQGYLDAHLHGPRRWAYEIVRRKASASLANRERLRFCRTRAFGSAKRMMRSIGRDLARMGAIATFDDIFMLRLEELRGVFEGAIAHCELRELVAVRRRQQARDEALVAPSRFTTRGVPYWNGNLEAAGWSSAGAVRSGVRELRGTPSSPGTAEGVAVVATEPRDVNGGVLIAYRTDPGWVAALPAVSGLVIERGSPLTHVAVVARELGIPTVVQVKGVTREIQTGMRIRVDGGTGLITVLEDPVLEDPVLEDPVPEEEDPVLEDPVPEEEVPALEDSVPEEEVPALEDSVLTDPALEDQAVKNTAVQNAELNDPTHEVETSRMILSQEYLAELAGKALELIGAPAQWAVTLEGSIAEGFGNPGSDIDFLLVADGTADLPTMPSILFIDGRRVEIRTRSTRQVVQQFETVAAVVGKGPRQVARLSEDLLNRCQRLSRSFPIRHPHALAAIKNALPDGDFAAVMRVWWAEHARQSIRHAIALGVLGEHAEAASWCQAGLLQAAKSWAAGQGETYLEPKWLSAQLGRLGRSELSDRYWRLETLTVSGLAPSRYVAGCVELAADFGISGCGWRPELLTVERVSGVTTWQTGERVHVVRAKQDVFALGEVTARAWRSVVFGRALPAVCAAAAAAGATEAGALIATFLRYGLLRLHWRGGGPVVPALPMAAPAGPVTPPPSSVRPLLGVAGARVGDPRAVDLIPLPARRFGAAAMSMIAANVLIENSFEDFNGALASGQWRVAELTGRRALHSGLRGVLSAYGVNPLPPDTEVLRRLSLLPLTVSPIREAAQRLDGLSITSSEQGEAIRAELDEFVALTREVMGEFPSSFHGASGWRATLDISYDWLRLGAYLDSELPIDEARDLLTSGGAQPHVAGEMFHRGGGKR